MGAPETFQISLQDLAGLLEDDEGDDSSKEEAPLEEVDEGQFWAFMQTNINFLAEQLRAIDGQQRNLEAALFNLETQREKMHGNIMDMLGILHQAKAMERAGYRVRYQLSDDGAYHIEFEKKEPLGFQTPSRGKSERTEELQVTSGAME